jgi:hypothetical protein
MKSQAKPGKCEQQSHEREIEMSWLKHFAFCANTMEIKINVAIN